MGALDGLKVLDFTTLLPGPYATLLLADLGAEVLKISSKDKCDLVTHWPPVIEGTETTAAAAWLGRNKKTMHLNLKKPEAVETVKKLIMEYDIVIEQFRPGVMNKLGLDYETLRTVNPRLIYCSLTGYGQTGALHERAGHDINYISRSGLMASSGRKNGGPVLYGMQIADVAVGSMNSVVGILAAVYHREKTGQGQYVDVAMLDGMIPFNTMDGGYMSVGSLEPKFFAELCRGLGFPEWADGSILKTNAIMAKETFKSTFKKKTRDEWTQIFAKLDACVEPVINLEEAAADEHLNERGMWPEVDLPETEYLKVRQLGCPVKLSACPPVYQHAGYPEGWHTQNILSGLGYSDEEIEAMQ